MCAAVSLCLCGTEEEGSVECYWNAIQLECVTMQSCWMLMKPLSTVSEWTRPWLRSTALCFFFVYTAKRTRRCLELDHKELRRDMDCMRSVLWGLITCWVSSYVSPSGSSIASPWPSIASCPYSSGCRDTQRENKSAVTKATIHVCGYLNLKYKGWYYSIFTIL